MNDPVKKYISVFNEAEDYLKKYLKEDKKSMEYLINQASKKHTVVRKYKDELHHFRKLRNVIVHNTKEGEYIASPFESTVKRFQKVYNEIADPPLVYKKNNIQVKTFDSEDKLYEVLEEVKKYSFTQFPIYENKSFKGLLTTNGITNALANMFNLEEGGVILGDDMQIIEILPHEEYKENYIFVPKDFNMYEAMDAFNNDKNLIDALLVTHNGKSTESLLGIVTIWDVMKFTESL